MDKDRARELIRKLTKHAENPSATPAERESYLAKARELAAKVGERPPTDTSRGNTDEITLERALRVVCNFGKYRERLLQHVMQDDLDHWLWMVSVAKSGHGSMYLEQRLAVLKLEENRYRLNTSPDDHEREQNRRETDKTRKAVTNAWKKYEARKKDREAAAAREEAERLAKEMKDWWEAVDGKETNIPNGRYATSTSEPRFTMCQDCKTGVGPTCGDCENPTRIGSGWHKTRKCNSCGYTQTVSRMDRLDVLCQSCWTKGTAGTVTTNSGQKINVVGWRVVDSDGKEQRSGGFDVTG